MRVRFEELLARHEREIYRFARRLTGNPADAADVLQDTFLRAFRAFSRLPEDANHRAWLYRIASRSASNSRRASHTRRAAPLEAARHVAARNGDLDAFVDAKRLRHVLVASVRDLSWRQRVALIQRKYENRSYKEIAVMLDCNEQTARAHVYQAMTRLRVKFGSAARRASSGGAQGGAR
jgi:RNA polymerase sigma-70 factor (ECF subfamily)